MRSGTTQQKMCIKFRFQSYRFLVINYELTAFQGRVAKNILRLRNGPDKNDSNNGNEHVGMQKKVLTFLLSVLTCDWLKQQKLTKLHKAVHIFILTFQPSSI